MKWLADKNSNPIDMLTMMIIGGFIVQGDYISMVLAVIIGAIISNVVDALV